VDKFVFAQINAAVVVFILGLEEHKIAGPELIGPDAAPLPHLLLSHAGQQPVEHLLVDRLNEARAVDSLLRISAPLVGNSEPSVHMLPNLLLYGAWIHDHHEPGLHPFLLLRLGGSRVLARGVLARGVRGGDGRGGLVLLPNLLG
jgi:hypothetical protein